MKIISHRGNLYGPNKNYENTIESINKCLDLNFDVEIDVWFINNKLYLGHDQPQNNVNLDFLKNDKFWCHAKNLDSLHFMLDNNIKCFWHENDKFTITSNGIIWTFPGNMLTSRSICVMPETQKVNFEDIKNLYGICTDYPINYLEKIK